MNPLTASVNALQIMVERVVALTGVMHSTTTLTLTTPVPYRIQPLLYSLTDRIGWGRAIPAVANDR